MKTNKKLTQQANDKYELVLRNQVYKTTLEYCSETCDNVDMLYMAAYVGIASALILTDNERDMLFNKLTQLNNGTKDVGTRKLRKAFVNYVLENQKD